MEAMSEQEQRDWFQAALEVLTRRLGEINECCRPTGQGENVGAEDASSGDIDIEATGSHLYYYTSLNHHPMRPCLAG